MSYRLPCDCGRPVPVAATDAGTTARCPCGRAVEVPPLHQLRAVAGEETVSPVVALRSLLLAGRLPGTRRCARCGRDADGLAHADMKCEWAVMTGGPSKAEVAAGCLVFGALGALLLARSLADRGSKQHGDDVVLTVPVRVCDGCRPDLADPAGLRDALRQTPEYAALLDKYPAARITLRG